MCLWCFYYKEKNILKRIFFNEHEHWPAFKRKYGDRIRPIVIKEVEKFLDCGNTQNGFKLFECECCCDVRNVLL
ncbi:hypothetical protein GMD78_03430 [Ornithinibacillus sp. L9]|uniref:Transposase zinc-binding domain-containing protein n=1 Tax=Ornithinibacillus caprae TaxID=2678566 RepID=A0A6N8FE25_9BACI|nr:hypothetical protein [Ornithinibacillus caprae]